MSELVLVTGGAGYIGSVLVPQLLAEGYYVRVLDNFRHRQPSLLAHAGDERLDIVRGDCRRGKVLRHSLREAQWSIPLAAIVGAPACYADPTAAVSTNVEELRQIVNRSESSGSV